MELMALNKALERLSEMKTREDVVIHLDSEYVKNGTTKWIANWKKNGWRTAAKKPVLNKEIWEEIDHYYEKVKEMHDLDLKYVQGHMGVGGNEIVDTIARTLAASEPWTLYSGKIEDFEKLRGLKL